jgi:hypothetical protein
MSARTAASDRDYDVETGNETPDPRLAEEEYRERRLAEAIEWFRRDIKCWPNVWHWSAPEHLSSVLREAMPSAYTEEFGLGATLRALASALEPPQ